MTSAEMTARLLKKKTDEIKKISTLCIWVILQNDAEKKYQTILGKKVANKSNYTNFKKWKPLTAEFRLVVRKNI